MEFTYGRTAQPLLKPGFCEESLVAYLVADRSFSRLEQLLFYLISMLCLGCP